MVTYPEKEENAEKQSVSVHFFSKEKVRILGLLDLIPSLKLDI